MGEYVALDVAMKSSVMSVRDGVGQRIWRGKISTDLDTIERTIRQHAPAAVAVGFETGPLAVWLFHGLRARGIPAVCMDARHAHRWLSLSPVKSDEQDADGLSELLWMGKHKPVEVKSLAAHVLRAVIEARHRLVCMRVDLENAIRGLLRTFGLQVGAAKNGVFVRRVSSLTESQDQAAALVLPLLEVLASVRQQIVAVSKQIRALARGHETCRRLMTVPGIAGMTALCYVATLDDPHRFRRSTSVGAYLGLTPRRYASGETDYDGRISRCGDATLRRLLFQAAGTLLTRVRRPCALQAWGRALAKRCGHRKAQVTLARKLAVLLHKLWLSGETFRWGDEASPAC